MGLLSRVKAFLRGPRYRINREILAEYVNESMQFSVENDLSLCDEFYLSPTEDGIAEHIIIINNDATCDCPLESEKDFTGFTLYVNRSSYYNPEKDEIYRSIEELIRYKLADFPEWFIIRGEIVEADKYELKPVEY